MVHCEDIVNLEWVNEAFGKSFSEQMQSEIRESKLTMATKDGYISELQKFKDPSASFLAPAFSSRGSSGKQLPTVFRRAR